MYTATPRDATATVNDNKNLKNDVREFANETKDDLRDVAHKAGTKVRSLFNNASDEISHATDTVTTQIRTKPIQSSMIALGVGFILGALFRR